MELKELSIIYKTLRLKLCALAPLRAKKGLFARRDILMADIFEWQITWINTN